jgi:DNA-binding NarL/FixJ family response regulator
MATGTPGSLIRVLAVDDHPLLREGIAALVGGQPDMELVGEAANGREAIQRYQELQPDVVLMDIQMPELGGIDAIRGIRNHSSTAKIIVLTTYGGDALAERALRAGAQAYVLKAMVRKDLLDTIRAVHGGARRVQSEVAAQLANFMGQDGLSGREIEVLALAAAGSANKVIATQLSITEDTIKGHMKSIMAKLGANDRTHAVTLALKRGIIEL